MRGRFLYVSKSNKMKGRVEKRQEKTVYVIYTESESISGSSFVCEGKTSA